MFICTHIKLLIIIFESLWNNFMNTLFLWWHIILSMSFSLQVIIHITLMLDDKMTWMSKISIENVTGIKSFQIWLKNNYENMMSSSYYHIIIYLSIASLIYDHNFFRTRFERISYDHSQLCSCLRHLVINFLVAKDIILFSVSWITFRLLENIVVG